MKEKFADLQAHMEPNMQVANDAPLLPDLNRLQKKNGGWKIVYPPPTFNREEKFVELQAHMEPNMQVTDDAPLLPDLNVSKRRTEAHMEPNMQVTDDAPLLPDLNVSKRRTEEKFADLQAHMEPNMQVANDAPLLPDLNVSKRRTEEKFADLQAHMEPNMQVANDAPLLPRSKRLQKKNGGINCRTLICAHMEPNMQVTDDAPLLPDLNVSKRRTEEKFADLQAHMEPNMQVANDAPLLPDLNVSKRRTEFDDAPLLPDLNVSKRRTEAHMEPNMQVLDDAPLLPDLNVSKRRTEEKFADLQAHMEPNMQVPNDAPLLPDRNVSKRRTEEKFADLRAHMEPNMQVPNDAPLLPDRNVSKRRTEEKFVDLQAHMEPNMQVPNDAPLLPDLNVSKRRTEAHMEPNMQVTDDAPLLPDLNVSKRRTEDHCNPPELVAVEQRRGSVCQKVFDSVKSMFGHINCHPVRGWKIVYHPPTFNREEKFAQLRAHMEPNMQVTDDAPLLPDLNVSKRRTREEKFAQFQAHMEPNMQVTDDAPLLPDLNVSKIRTEDHCNPPELVAVEQRRCSVCQKVFDSVKSMFGHINCHPVRGWKIVYPPPTFNREEKFAELQAHMEPNMQVTDDAPLLPDLNVSKRRTEDHCNPPELVAVEQRRCSVCQKVFDSVKSMFGHINCHPVRGWKIVYPPPTFNREEKFAELQAHMEPNMQVTDDAPLLPDLNVSKRRTERNIRTIATHPNLWRWSKDVVREEKFVELRRIWNQTCKFDDAPLLPDLNVSKRRTEDHCNPPEHVAVEQRRGSVCQKVFDSVKSMFGHINCHPVRGWKIVYPPPTINGEEKFVELRRIWNQTCKLR
ncbi:hypothetical protein RND71_002038 [Anisodus tanguticus]|uniref:C2H2-type domain-containing protein n=1 Tax=Anisodus tanguticus TaxID=243964 RepID=A0AAE1T252_9SOLA|nr:hypothetical protein RND71_002038 [Anisodus tanguticus]